MLCLDTEATEGVLVPWLHGSSWAENQQQWFPVPSPDCSCLVLLPASQHHRLVEVGRNLWRSISPTPVLKQGHLEPVPQDCV